MNKTTTIFGFLLSFLAGMAFIWGVDRRAHSEGVSGGPDTARPANPGAVQVDLHVMSQCPYGVQAENAFKDVVTKFGKDLDLRVEFIGQTSPSGDLSSMHGPNEVKGDLLQACAQKYAPTKYFDFILCQNKNSKEVATNWDTCAKETGIPGDKISACADGPEGKDLLAASFKRSQEKGARGSPTIFVGGQKYEGGRKPTDFMKAICNAGGAKKPAGCADIPEPPKVNVTVLGDKRCGEDCDTTRYERSIKGTVGAPVMKNLDYSSPEGKALYAQIKP